MNAPKMVRVRWLDSGLHRDLGWGTPSEYRNGDEIAKMEVITVGQLMDQDEETVAVGLNYDPTHDTWLSVQFIARTNIIRMDMLHT